MSSRVFVPFDNNPLAVSVKTASYTIPTGRFAKVYVECDSGGQFTINGAVAVDTDPVINVSVSIASSNALTYTAPSNYKANVSVYSNTSGLLVYQSGLTATYQQAVNSLSSGGGMGLITVGPGGSVSITSSGAAAKAIVGYAEPSNATNRQAEFFLPAGTVISGSGNWKAVVMEYNAIS